MRINKGIEITKYLQRRNMQNINDKNTINYVYKIYLHVHKLKTKFDQKPNFYGSVQKEPLRMAESYEF